MIAIPFLRKRFRASALTLAPAVLFVVTAYAQPQPIGVANFHVVNERLYRGAQPSDQGFRSLAAMGVKTVLDLREFDGRSAAEKKAVEAAGMKYVNVPMQGTNTPQPADVAKALSILSDKDSGTVFVHCRRGADRTGTIVACYRVAHDGWDSLKALDEAKALGMAWYAGAMHRFIHDYRAPVQNATAANPSGMN